MNLAELPERVDLVIVGAGPAGIAAAVEASACGLCVLVADENPAAGGQIFRGLGGPLARSAVLGPEHAAGGDCVHALERSAATVALGTTVFAVETAGDGFCVGLYRDGVARRLEASSVLVAAGALERPFPIGGWTLPGVMTAGAAQILLKTGAVVPEGPTVLAGTGPLLWLLAAQYARAEVPLAAILDTTPPLRLLRAAALAPAFLASSYARKGIGLLREARRGTRIVTGVTALIAAGQGSLDEVAFTAGGREGRIAARTLLLHQGVAPQVNLAMAAGCRHGWNDERLAFEPLRNALLESSVPGLFIAGDAGGIAGAAAASAQGRLAAAAVAARALRISEADLRARAAACRRSIARAERGRAFLNAVFRPADAFRRPADDVVVCRCEGVTAGAVRAAAARGAPGPNQVKAFLRAGMGPCQGRLCGLTVSEIMAETAGRPVEAIGHYGLRPPVKPITLAALAALRTPRSAAEAKARRLS